MELHGKPLDGSGSAPSSLRRNRLCRDSSGWCTSGNSRKAQSSRKEAGPVRAADRFSLADCRAEPGSRIPPMTPSSVVSRGQTSPEIRLVISLLCSYLFFLSRRPVSRSNLHYLARRLAGLKSLSEKLDAAGSPDLSAIAKQLKLIQPANFPTLSRALQFQLALTQKPVTIPAHYIVSVRPPRPGLIAD